MKRGQTGGGMRDEGRWVGDGSGGKCGVAAKVEWWRRKK